MTVYSYTVNKYVNPCVVINFLQFSYLFCFVLWSTNHIKFILYSLDSSCPVCKPQKYVVNNNSIGILNLVS